MSRIILAGFLSLFISLSFSARAQDTTKTQSPVVTDTTGNQEESIAPPSPEAPIELSQVGQDSTQIKKDSTAQLVIDSSTTNGNTDTAVVIDTTGKVEVGTQSNVNQELLTGIVYEKDGETTIPGATVQWVTNPVSVQTDLDGKFSIVARPEGGALTVSSVGFSVQKIQVEPGQNDLKITMGLSAGTKINEVVITALGQERDTRALGYAIQSLEGRSVQEAKAVNFINGMQGKLAGVQINGNSGSMNGSAKVVIRGLKSISGNNNALFIVDGVPMANINMNTVNGSQAAGGGGYDYGNPAQLINPNDIEDISVLKSAASTALYGSRGQNGVVYITTKSGKGSGKVSVNYDLNLQMDRISYLPKFQNEYGAGSGSKGFDTLYFNEHPEGFGPGGGTYNDNNGRGSYDLLPEYMTDLSWGPRLDGQQVRHWWSWDAGKNNPDFGKTAPWTAQPDNVRDFFQNGYMLSNNLSVASSGDNGSIRFSMGQTKQSFIYPGSNLDRAFAGLNTLYKFNDKFSFSGGFNYIMDKSKGRSSTGFAGNNPIQQMVMYGQRQLDNETLKNYKYEDGTQRNWNRTSWDNGAPTAAENPYWNQYENYNTDRNDRFYGNVGLTYKFADWIEADARVFTDYFDHIDEVRGARSFLLGAYQRRNINLNENNYQLLLKLNKELSKDFKINGTLGGNIRNVRMVTDYGSVNGGLSIPGVYALSNSILPATVSTTYDVDNNKQINSVFAQATLAYKKLLYLDITGRNDWASTLKQTGNYSFFYPSVSGSFIFSDLIATNKWLTMGKLRASVAQVGNDIPAYQVNPYYTQLPSYQGSPLLTTQDVRYSADLKPEKTTEVEGGLDLRFLNDRIGINFTYYNRNTVNQFWNIEVPSSSGYSSKVINGGNIRNRGIELSLSATPLQIGSFRWETALNLARNRNMVVDLNSTDGSFQSNKVIMFTERRTGKVSMVAQKGYPLGTLVGTDYVYDANGNKVVGDNGYYLVSDSTVVIGDANPDFFGGWSNTFSYKGFYVSALIDFQSGGDFFSYTNMYGNISGNLAESAADGIRENGIIVPGVKKDGSVNDIRISAQNHFTNNFGTRISSASMYDASYIYLREVRLGYYLPERWVNHIGMQSARLSLVGRNLWLMKSNAPNVDPSNITNSTSSAQGFDGGALPPVRSYGINLNINF